MVECYKYVKTFNVRRLKMQQFAKKGQMRICIKLRDWKKDTSGKNLCVESYYHVCTTCYK